MPDKISEFPALKGKDLSSNYMLGFILSFLPDLSHLILIKKKVRYYYSSHLTAEESEAYEV